MSRLPHRRPRGRRADEARPGKSLPSLSSAIRPERTAFSARIERREVRRDPNMSFTWPPSASVVKITPSLSPPSTSQASARSIAARRAAAAHARLRKKPSLNDADVKRPAFRQNSSDARAVDRCNWSRIQRRGPASAGSGAPAGRADKPGRASKPEAASLHRGREWPRQSSAGLVGRDPLAARGRGQPLHRIGRPTSISF